MMQKEKFGADMKLRNDSFRSVDFLKYCSALLEANLCECLWGRTDAGIRRGVGYIFLKALAIIVVDF